jgi:hypothetical protein
LSIRGLLHHVAREAGLPEDTIRSIDPHVSSEEDAASYMGNYKDGYLLDGGDGGHNHSL